MVKQPRTPKAPLTPAQVDALDRDDDGQAGGSKPKARPDEAASEERSEVPSAASSEHQAGARQASGQDASPDTGKAGGVEKRLSSHEFAAICAEAYEAYDFQDERVRFDTLGRRWQFRPDKIGQGESVLSLQLSRLDAVRTDTISTAVLASEMGRDMVADVVKAMAEGVG